MRLLRPLRLGGVLPHAYAGDLRFGVDDRGDQVPVHVPGPARNPFRHRNAVLLRLVGEHGSGDDVADGPDSGGIGAEVAVHLHALLLVEDDAGLVQAEAVGVGPPAHGDENPVRGKLQDLAVALGGEDRLLAVPLQSGHLGAGLDLQALPLEQAGEGADDVVVVDGDDLRQEFNHRHIASQAGPDRAELEADGAAADDDERRRDLVEGDRLVARDDGLAVEFEGGDLDRRRAGGDDEILGADGSVLPSCWLLPVTSIAVGET